MTDLYNKTSERLWEKLEYYKNKLDINCLNFEEPFLIDQLTKHNPIVSKLINEVQEEFKYSMSEFQCSWAVNQFVKGGLILMELYNEVNSTNLQPRK